MRLSEDRLSPHRLTLLAFYVGALFYFAALLATYLTSTTLPDLLNATIGLATSTLLTLITLILLALAYLYIKGHKYAIELAILAMTISIPFLFDSHAFLNSSVPQGIWLPFIFALAVSNVRVALIALAVSLFAALATYPDAFRTPRAVIETMIICFILIAGKLITLNMLENLIKKQTDAAQLAINESNLTLSSEQYSQQQQRFIHYAPINIVMVDLAMNYLACSEQWRQENGHGSNENLIGLNYYALNPDSSSEWRALHQQALEGISVKNKEFLWTQSNGTPRWVRCSARPWKFDSGEIGGLIISQEDITTYKVAETDLQSVLEESGDAIWIINSTGNFIYANPSARKLTGYKASEIKHLYFSDIIREDHEDELLEYLALTQNAKFTRREWMLNHKNGSAVCVELTTGLCSTA